MVCKHNRIAFTQDTDEAGTVYFTGAKCFACSETWAHSEVEQAVKFFDWLMYHAMPTDLAGVTRLYQEWLED